MQTANVSLHLWQRHQHFCSQHKSSPRGHNNYFPLYYNLGLFLLQYAIAFELRPHHSSHHPESILIDLNFVDVNHNHKCSNHLPPTNLLLFAAIQASLSINCPKANSTILGENAGLSDLTFSSGSTKLPISVCSALFFTLAAEVLTLVKQ